MRIPPGGIAPSFRCSLKMKFVERSFHFCPIAHGFRLSNPLILLVLTIKWNLNCMPPCRSDELRLERFLCYSHLTPFMPSTRRSLLHSFNSPELLLGLRFRSRTPRSSEMLMRETVFFRIRSWEYTTSQVGTTVDSIFFFFEERGSAFCLDFAYLKVEYAFNPGSCILRVS